MVHVSEAPKGKSSNIYVLEATFKDTMKVIARLWVVRLYRHVLLHVFAMQSCHPVAKLVWISLRRREILSPTPEWNAGGLQKKHVCEVYAIFFVSSKTSKKECLKDNGVLGGKCPICLKRLCFPIYIYMSTIAIYLLFTKIVWEDQAVHVITLIGIPVIGILRFLELNKKQDPQKQTPASPHFGILEIWELVDLPSRNV